MAPSVDFFFHSPSLPCLSTAIILFLEGRRDEESGKSPSWDSSVHKWFVTFFSFLSRVWNLNIFFFFYVFLSHPLFLLARKKKWNGMCASGYSTRVLSTIKFLEFLFLGFEGLGFKGFFYRLGGQRGSNLKEVMAEDKKTR